MSNCSSVTALNTCIGKQKSFSKNLQIPSTRWSNFETLSMNKFQTEQGEKNLSKFYLRAIIGPSRLMKLGL